MHEYSFQENKGLTNTTKENAATAQQKHPQMKATLPVPNSAGALDLDQPNRLVPGDFKDCGNSSQN